MRLLLIRHAESQGNRELRLQGRRDFPLTPKGYAQARALAARLASEGLSAVYASPITRAFATAECVASACSVEVTPRPDLQEYDFGDLLSGLTWKEIQGKHPELVATLVGDDTEFPRYPGEEGRGAFRERVCRQINQIAEQNREARQVAVVTHAGPIFAYLMEALSRKYSRPIPVSIDNASITTVERYEPRSFADIVVTGINDTCHLRKVKAVERPIEESDD